MQTGLIMVNKYAQAMAAFFNGIDKETEAQPEKLALAFANHFKKGRSFLTGMKIELPVENIYNVTIANRSTPLSFITRRLPLIADTTVITHYRENKQRFHEYHDPIGMYEGPIGAVAATTCYLRCPHLIELGVWLRDCKPLLLEGDVFYWPDIVVERMYGQDIRSADISESEVSTQPLCDVIIQNKKLVDISTTNPVKSQIIRPMLLVDLPYIENVDLATFAKITSDEREAVEQFRDFLRAKFLDLKQNEESERFETNLAKIGIELRDGLRKLESDYVALKRKRAFQVTGATIAAATAVLVVISSTAFGMLPELLGTVGTGGGLLAIAKALQEHISNRQKTIKETPYYYLWLLSRKANKR